MTASHSTPTFDVFQSDSLNNSNSKSTDSQVRWRVRLVHIDFYLNFGASVKSSSGTTSSRTDKSPVIRIFGSSDQGQKVCLHIHQVYPYFYIPFPFSGEKPQYSALDSYLTGLTIEWNKRLGLLLVKNDIDSNDQSPQNNTMQDRKVNHEIHIRQVLLVKGIPYYGFHPGYQLYLKVYVINPFAYNRIVDTFHSGSLLGHRVQTFHSHLSFPLQFMMDFNLYGMDTIELSQVRFRGASIELPVKRNIMFKIK
jgi:DNA polymerase zeta